MLYAHINLFFEKNIISVFLIYGLSLFFIAMAILLSYRSLRLAGLSDIFLYLFPFSIIHGAVEWMDMYNSYQHILNNQGISSTLLHIRFYLLSASFFFLFIFGLTLIVRTKSSALNITLNIKRYTMGLSLAFIGLLIISSYSGLLNTNMQDMEAGVRYFLGFPSSLMAAMAFYSLSHKEYSGLLPEGYQSYFRYTCYFFILYGIFTGIIAPANKIVFSTFLNQNIFIQYTGIPVQIFRMLAISSIAYFIIRAMAIRILLRLVATFILFSIMTVILGITGFINIELVSRNYKQLEKIGAEEKSFFHMVQSSNHLYEVVQSTKGTRGYEKEKLLNPLIAVYVDEFELALNEVKSVKHEDEKEVLLISDISKFLEKFHENGIVNIRAEDLYRLKSMVDEISAIHSLEVAEVREDVFKGFWFYKWVIFVALITSILGLIFVLYTFYKMIILPLNKLKAGAKRIGDGDLGYRIDIQTADEFQELGDDFNIMGERLLERTKKLEEATGELRELSIRDGLTGLFNHRYFYHKLEEEFKRARRYNTNLSILIMDVDDFKDYNDTLGHPKGDELLRGIAEIIRRNTRDTDTACRYGGEELYYLRQERKRRLFMPRG